MMAKMTLLDLVQSILNDMDSDEVNSINDTIESEQVSIIVKDTFKAIIDNRNWPHLRKLIQIDSSGDLTQPTHITVPSNVKKMLYLAYNKQKTGESRRRYEELTWLEPDDFLRHLNTRNNENTNTDVITDPSGIELLILNDRHPTYFTSFDDENLVLDSYDKSVDDTIQESKTQARAVVAPLWEHVDSHIPDLPEEAFTALLEEAKSRAMFRLKQVQDIKAESEARRQQSWLSREAFKVKGGVQYPDYGRRTRGYQNRRPNLDKES